MKKEKLLSFAQADLHNVLNWWATYTVDEKNGGFYGAVSGENVPAEEAERFLVLNARILWTFAAAYGYTNDEKHKALAGRAYDYLIKHFHDKEHGGFYAYVNYRGEVSNNRKFTYGNVYAVYALAEYARLFDHADAKKLAQETVEILDKYMWDTEHMGYLEVATREWEYLPETNMLGYSPDTEKTMNTHLHVVEAYATLLRIDNSPRLRHRVRTLLYLFLDKIINPSVWHFHYWQRRDWSLTNGNYSIGHDIEGTWLLLEAAEILGEPEVITDVRRACILMARAVYDIGTNAEGGVYTEYDIHKREPAKHLSWWEQTEGVVGFLNAYEMTGEEKFLDASVKTLDFIDKYFIDREYGGWYIRPKRNGKAFNLKASPFHCPYHNARMDMEIIRRLTAKN
jgi:mannobiose 2-epimerase